MNTSRFADASPSLVKPMAAAIVALFGFNATAMATDRPVTSCLDDINVDGTLRKVVSTAATNDTIDLSGLSCPNSKITLTTGSQHIAVPQQSLTIKGPPAGTFIIDGTLLDTYYKNYSNVFYHTGNGTLTIQDLTVVGGHQSHRQINGLGGCVYSKGDVQLAHVVISSCSAYSKLLDGRGGAVYAKGDVSASHSTISGNSASGVNGTGGAIWANGNVSLTATTVSGNAASGGGAAAGGVFAAGTLQLVRSALTGNSSTASNGNARAGGAYVGNLDAQYSSIESNHVTATGFGPGGGVYVAGDASIYNSTIADNTATGGFGGLVQFTLSPSGHKFHMRNSTVSGNSAGGATGGLYVNAPDTRIYNSTVAFNTSGSGASGSGLVVGANFFPVTANLQGTLLSNNSYAGSDNDLATINGVDVSFAGGAKNLVRVSFVVNPLPGDTKSGTCPTLGPLRDNGGLTRSHALLSGSIAIGNGNNVGTNPATMQPYAYDQRGSADVNSILDYLRLSAPLGDPSPQPDIGAYEVQQNEIVFGAGFDGCNPVPV